MPYNIEDSPIINHWTFKECEELIFNININSDIRKAVFVYDSKKISYVNIKE